MADLHKIEGLLQECNARYETEGLASLRKIPGGSVDFVFSNAVLQMVRRSELPEIVAELHRVLRPRGAGSPSVGLWDHFGNALNPLRFPERFWESRWVARSGFYTNRYRYPEMLELFRRAGFRVELTEMNRWNRLPNARGALRPEFRGFGDDDLRVRSFNVVWRRD